MRNYLFVLLFLSGLSVNAQQIKGIVQDAETKEPLTHTSVLIAGEGKGTTTNKEGKFVLQIPQDKEVSLLITSLGYKGDSVKIVAGKTNYVILLTKEQSNLSEVVVSGTMKAVSKMQSPIPVEVYTPSYFKRNPSPSLFESLNMVTGVQPQLNCNVCNTGDIHINGLEGPYTMILIDGMPIVSSLSTVYGLHGLPQSMIKRMEVVKGPASTLYGSEAVAGLINVITKDPSSSPLFSFDVSSTSWKEANVDAAVKWKAGKTATSVFGVNYFNYTSPKDENGDNFTDVTLQNRISLFNKWSFDRKSGKAASIATRYVHEFRWGGEMDWSRRWQGSDSVYGESIMTDRVELIGNYELPVKNENLKFQYSYNYHLQDSYYGTVKYYASQHTAFAQLLWDKNFDKVSLLAGLPFRYTYYDDNTPSTATKDGLHNKASKTYLPGVFVQSEIQLDKKLTTLIGLRYDHNNLQGGIVTPRLSFKYSPSYNHTLRLTGGNGYRIVNLFTEDHAALTGAREVIIKNDLKPEKSWNGNLNYTGFYNFGSARIGVDASAFYTYFTNRIVADFLTDPQKIFYDNLSGHAISKGFSVNIDGSMDNWKLIAGITVMNVYKVEKDSTSGKNFQVPQQFAPKFSGTYSLSYTFDKADVTIDYTGKVNGSMYLPVLPNDYRPETSPLYCLMNLQVTKKFKNDIEVYAGVKNLLNFLPKDPLMRPFDPFDKHINDPVNNPNGYTFDTTYNYAPLQGARGFLGVRWSVY